MILTNLFLEFRSARQKHDVRTWPHSVLQWRRELPIHVYDSLVALKHNKLSGLTNSTTQEAVVDASTPVPKLVVTIPEDLQLDSHERSSLKKRPELYSY